MVDVRKLEFDTEDPEFERGYEFGMMYLAIGQAVQRYPVWSRPIQYEAHASNTEMAIRLAEFFMVDVQAEIIDETMSRFSFTRKTFDH